MRISAAHNARSSSVKAECARLPALPWLPGTYLGGPGLVVAWLPGGALLLLIEIEIEIALSPPSHPASGRPLIKSYPYPSLFYYYYKTSFVP